MKSFYLAVQIRAKGRKMEGRFLTRGVNLTGDRQTERKVEAASGLLTDYNARLQEELKERKKVGIMVAEFLSAQKELLAQVQQTIGKEEKTVRILSMATLKWAGELAAPVGKLNHSKLPLGVRNLVSGCDSLSIRRAKYACLRSSALYRTLDFRNCNVLFISGITEAGDSSN